MDWLINLISIFNTYAKTNQVVAGAMSLWGLGVLSYFGRNIPWKIWNIIVRQTTTTMVLMSSSPTFYNFQTWFCKRGYSDKVRSVKISSGKWGEDKAVKSMGYGKHYLLHKYIPFKVEMTKVDATNNIMERDEITITILGRSHKFFDILFEEIQHNVLEEEKLQIFKYNTDYWLKVSEQLKRNIDTVFLQKETKDTVLSHIDKFILNEDWYIDNGLSYQTGILLYGHPGCGKTSFIKSIASKYNMPIYILSAGMLYCIDKAVLGLPKKCLFLIEDIDTDCALYKRDHPKEGPDAPTVQHTNELKFSFTNFSDVLNSLDGIINIHGRILIATTNHMEKLDDALLRNGRFDLKVYIGYATNYTVERFFERYYPNFIFDPNFEIKDKIPASKIQNLIIRNLETPEIVIKQIGKE